jgi:hypothetical protein
MSTEEAPVYGPQRKAPHYYIGEHVGKYRTVRLDVERNKNGSLGGIRNKAARRIIRAAFKDSHSSFTKGLKLARAMQDQARELARTEKKSTRWARRLYDKELSIHQPVYAPSHKELRAMRTAARKAKRKGLSNGVVNDAISQLVDKMEK